MSSKVNPHYIYLFDQLNVDFDKVKICVETGTYEGDGSVTFASLFESVRTVELSEELYNLCCEKYKAYDTIMFYKGASTNRLKEMVRDIKDPYFLFLDAHGSGENTVWDGDYGLHGSPVLEELDCVKQNPPAWIVIDDLRDFDDPNKNYPSREDIVQKVSEVGSYEAPLAINVGDPDHYLFGVPQWYCFKRV